VKQQSKEEPILPASRRYLPDKLFIKEFKLMNTKVIVLGVFLVLMIILFSQCVYAEQQISQFGITWTFDRDYQVGRFANGDYWVLGPVIITAIEPASTKVDGRTINGSMVNPSPKLGNKQGYDSTMYGKYGPRFEPDLNVARPEDQDIGPNNPLILKPYSSFVSTISIKKSGNRPQIKTAAVLTVLAEPAPQGSFRPPYCGTDKTIRFNKNQLNYSLLKKLKPVPGAPSLAKVERYFERPWIDHVPGWIGRYHHPKDNMPDYDREVCTQVGIGALMLHLNFTNRQKEKLLIHYVQLGIDLYGVIQDGGRSNWLQDSGRKYPILFAGMMLDDSDMKNIGFINDPADPLYVRFEEDGATFYVTQTDVDMTHSPQWNPDRRAAQILAYTQEDIGLPEWGIVRLYDRSKINKCWRATYRNVIGHAYGGFVLAMHIMGVKDLWNHDAFFDYKDRYMQVQHVSRETSKFVEDMWDYYRPHYGPVWTMTPVLNVTASGGSVKKIPDKTEYRLGETVILRAVPEDGYQFRSWSGDLTGAENPVKIIMHANQSVIAHFAIRDRQAAPDSLERKPICEK
jgi:hypothetical protein